MMVNIWTMSFCLLFAFYSLHVGMCVDMDVRAVGHVRSEDNLSCQFSTSTLFGNRSLVLLYECWNSWSTSVQYSPVSNSHLSVGVLILSATVSSLRWDLRTKTHVPTFTHLPSKCFPPTFCYLYNCVCIYTHTRANICAYILILHK